MASSVARASSSYLVSVGLPCHSHGNLPEILAALSWGLEAQEYEDIEFRNHCVPHSHHTPTSSSPSSHCWRLVTMKNILLITDFRSVPRSVL